MLSLLRTAPPVPTAPRPPLVALVPEALGLLVGLAPGRAPSGGGTPGKGGMGGALGRSDNGSVKC